MIKFVWNHLEEFFLVPSIIFSVMLVFSQVIMRYIFGNSLAWSEELARYLFIWQIWIGASYAAKQNAHLRITVIKNWLSRSAQKKLEVIVVVIWIAFAVYIARNGYTLVERVGRFNQLSSAMRMPMMYAHLAVPVGFSLMIVRLIENSVKDLFLTEQAGQAEQYAGGESK